MQPDQTRENSHVDRIYFLVDHATLHPFMDGRSMGYGHRTIHLYERVSNLHSIVSARLARLRVHRPRLIIRARAHCGV